jgi:hypothetical protein
MEKQVKGISFDRQQNKWKVHKYVNGTRWYLGRYDCKDTAIQMAEIYVRLIIESDRRKQ